ncbi:g11045 [Coccomyxa elongata]
MLLIKTHQRSCCAVGQDLAERLEVSKQRARKIPAFRVGPLRTSRACCRSIRLEHVQPKAYPSGQKKNNRFTSVTRFSAAGNSGNGTSISSEGSAVTTAYTALAAIIGASAAARLAAPSLYVQLANSACPNATVQTLLRLTGATLLPVTAAFWALKGAAEHDRLGSNTYRRLNLGLVGWAAVNLALLSGETCALTSWCFSIQVAFYVATAAVGGYAWASSSGFAPTGRQIIDGFLGDVQALFGNKTFLSGLLAVLSVAAVAAGSLIINQPLEYFQPPEFRMGAGWLGKLAMRAYGANILFAAVVLTTLKDALDRGRHTASTFKLLAKAAAGTAIAEIAIFASTGSTSGVVRELLFGVIMASYLQKPRVS